MDERLFRRASAFAWAMVGVPMVIEPPITRWRLAAWAGAYVVFAALAWLSGGRRRPTLWAAESLAVFAMVIVLCNGFEGALLVLVAMQVGRHLAPRAGLLVIGAQTALLAVGIAVHWSPRSAVLLVPPYLGLQVLGFFLVRLLERVDATGRLTERLRIARDLHDGLGHHLTALSLNLEVAERQAQGDAAAPVATARGIAKLLLAEVRAAVSAMGEGDRVDLGARLRRLVAIAELPSPKVHLRVADELSADAERADAILRCVQEIITNSARHARAENLWIEVAARGAVLEIRARDDGEGAADVRAGQGLRGMRERLERVGGTLVFHSRPRAGFVVVATLPHGRAP